MYGLDLGQVTYSMKYFGSFTGGRGNQHYISEKIE